MSTAFTITYDYLCPFARIANDAVIDVLEAGDDFEVTFAPFSLSHNHLSDDEPAVWDDDSPNADASGVLALQWSLAVRDSYGHRFRDFHRALFAARHDDGADVNDERVLAEVATLTGLDADAVAGIVADGVPMKTLRDEHTALVEEHAVFGVPTFIAGDEAVFVRLMDRDRPDDLRRVVDMVTWANLNEFKRTRIPR